MEGERVMVSILFVCLGNICRSPMAEAIFTDLAEKKGVKEEFNVDSAGIGDWHTGDLPHPGTRKILEDKEISYRGITARQVRKEDWKQFDYLIAMDNQTLSDLREWNNRAGDSSISRLMEHCQKADQLDIPDPYFTGDFDQAYRLVVAGCHALLDELIKKHNIRSEYNES